jgi:hypothetical protein
VLTPDRVLRSRLMAMTVDRDSPPARLRRTLEEQRDHGRSFRQAWPVAMNVALADAGMAADFWRQVFTDQRGVWATSYSRAPWPANRLPALWPLDDPPGTRAVVTVLA